MMDRVDGDRLWQRLMAMAEVGATANGGSNRQALSDDDAAGRALFQRWAADAGCTSEYDEIGNLFVRRPGTDPDLAPVLIGSHLDTQPTGGRFDGVFGVLGGLEVIESLNDRSVETTRPVEIAVWTNEEGSRFQHSMMGSAVWAGRLEMADAERLTDVDGFTVGQELDRLGWRGGPRSQGRDYHAAFELHIEQGPILETESVEVGVVTGVQGFRWFSIELNGFPAHAGPTPMVGRRDPAKAMASIIGQVYDMVDDVGPWGRGTFAQFTSLPVSPNTIPETMRCSLDLRHPDAVVLDEMEQRARAIVVSACESLGVGSTVTKENDSPPVAFDRGCISAVRSAVDELGFSNQELVSGAGHDACYVAGHCPTSMIFVPCDGGLSHNEAESISSAQAEQGASVLLGAVSRMANA